VQKRGRNPPEAATGLSNILSHIVKPSKMAKESIDSVGGALGDRLKFDFSEAGLRARGLTNILGDLKEAHDRFGLSIMKFIPEIRGARAAMILTGVGTQDYTEDLKALGGVTEATSPTNAAYARQQQTLAAQTARLDESMKVLAIDLGTVLIPAVQEVVGWISQGVDAFKELDKPTQAAIVKGLAFAGVALTAAGAITKLVGMAGTLAGGITKLMGVTTAATAVTAQETRETQVNTAAKQQAVAADNEATAAEEELAAAQSKTGLAASEEASAVASAAAEQVTAEESKAAATTEAEVASQGAMAATGEAAAGMATATGAAAATSEEAMTGMATAGEAELGGLAAAGGPIALVIAAVVGLGLAWSNNLFHMRDVTTSIVDEIKRKLDELHHKASGLFPNAPADNPEGKADQAQREAMQKATEDATKFANAQMALKHPNTDPASGDYSVQFQQLYNQKIHDMGGLDKIGADARNKYISGVQAGDAGKFPAGYNHLLVNEAADRVQKQFHTRAEKCGYAVDAMVELRTGLKGFHTEVMAQGKNYAARKAIPDREGNLPNNVIVHLMGEMGKNGKRGAGHWGIVEQGPNGAVLDEVETTGKKNHRVGRPNFTRSINPGSALYNRVDKAFFPTPEEAKAWNDLARKSGSTGAMAGAEAAAAASSGAIPKPSDAPDKKAVEDRARELADTYAAIFKSTHTELQIALNDARNLLYERENAGVPKSVAMKAFNQDVLAAREKAAADNAQHVADLYQKQLEAKKALVEKLKEQAKAEETVANRHLNITNASLAGSLASFPTDPAGRVSGDLRSRVAADGGLDTRLGAMMPVATSEGAVEGSAGGLASQNDRLSARLEMERQFEEANQHDLEMGREGLNAYRANLAERIALLQSWAAQQGEMGRRQTAEYQDSLDGLVQKYRQTTQEMTAKTETLFRPFTDSLSQALDKGFGNLGGRLGGRLGGIGKILGSTLSTELRDVFQESLQQAFKRLAVSGLLKNLFAHSAAGGGPGGIPFALPGIAGGPSRNGGTANNPLLPITQMLVASTRAQTVATGLSTVAAHLNTAAHVAGTAVTGVATGAHIANTVSTTANTVSTTANTVATSTSGGGGGLFGLAGPWGMVAGLGIGLLGGLLGGAFGGSSGPSTPPVYDGSHATVHIGVNIGTVHATTPQEAKDATANIASMIHQQLPNRFGGQAG
jgi:hypothetical protein